MSHPVIDMSDQQQSLKAFAALPGKSVKQYAREQLLPGDSEADQALQTLKSLLDERIHAGLSGQVSAHSIAEILDEELAAAKDGRA